jgi:RNA polymerase sigma-70 factor (ECF subfamily)
MLKLARASRKPGYRELEPLSDGEVMASLQAGSHDALAVLFDRYHRLVFTIALRIVRDEGEAEDLTQVVFLDIFRAAAQFDPAKGTTKVWLLQYAYHRALSRKRHLNVRNFYDLEGDERLSDVPLAGERPALGLTPVELRDLLDKGLASLTPSQRAVIEDASFGGLSMKEIAEKTGESLVNVRHHYYRGLRKLRAFVERQAEVDKAVGDA